MVFHPRSLLPVSLPLRCIIEDERLFLTRARSTALPLTLDTNSVGFDPAWTHFVYFHEKFTCRFSPINFPESTKTQRNKQNALKCHWFDAHLLTFTFETAL